MGKAAGISNGRVWVGFLGIFVHILEAVGNTGQLGRGPNSGVAFTALVGILTMSGAVGWIFVGTFTLFLYLFWSFTRCAAKNSVACEQRNVFGSCYPKRNVKSAALLLYAIPWVH